MGDSVISAIITKRLYIDFPKKEEGELSKIRAMIVGRNHLNKVGKGLFSEAQIKNKLQKIPQNIYGNTLEAIIGAIYIDKGLFFAEQFVVKNIYNPSRRTHTNSYDNDYKSKLQTKAQTKGAEVNYKVLETLGPEHNKEFLVAVFFNKKKISEGKGTSIKRAEKKAAEKAYNVLF